MSEASQVADRSVGEVHPVEGGVLVARHVALGEERTGLEDDDRPTGGGECGRDDPTTGPRADDDHVGLEADRRRRDPPQPVVARTAGSASGPVSPAGRRVGSPSPRAARFEPSVAERREGERADELPPGREDRPSLRDPRQAPVEEEALAGRPGPVTEPRRPTGQHEGRRPANRRPGVTSGAVGPATRRWTA